MFRGYYCDRSCATPPSLFVCSSHFLAALIKPSCAFLLRRLPSSSQLLYLHTIGGEPPPPTTIYIFMYIQVYVFFWNVAQLCVAQL